MTRVRHDASFRDPSGFLFTHEGRLYRQIEPVFAQEWAACAPLRRELIEAGLLVPHEELPSVPDFAPGAHAVIAPERLPFISHPYEWSFSQLQAAARLTLELQRRAVAHGCTLRDASAYNVQFVGSKAIFLDTLSLARREEGAPWIAYQQFCRHFLGPLALMAHVDVSLSQLARLHVDGPPLPLVSRLLPFGTKLRPSLLTHLHLHAGATARYADDAAVRAPKARAGGMGRAAMLGLIESLQGAVEALAWTPAGTEWGDYYSHTNYTDDAHAAKAALVAKLLEAAKARGPLETIWDLGANTGRFSRVAAETGAYVCAFDVDPAAVERNVREGVAKGERRILPLLQDLTNPSPALGWANAERASLAQRGPADVVLALALVHHLAISNNVPLEQLCGYLASLGRRLVLEFVPKTDSQVKRLLATREDVFPRYTLEGLLEASARSFTLLAREPIPGSERTLLLLERRA